MAQLRGVWPQVEQALKADHTLKVVHQRINSYGIPISYKLLTAYRSRMHREKAVGEPVTVGPPAEFAKHHTSKGFDPLANFYEHEERKAATWKYLAGPPDERKLIGEGKTQL